MSQSSTTASKARMPNPALHPFEFLIGAWRTTGSHPEVPGRTLHGRTSFSWHEGGAFLIMRADIDDPQFPDGIALIGSDNIAGKFAMAYFDERGTSRIFDVTAGDRTVTWHRDNPKFSQSITISAESGGDTLTSRGRMSKGGGPWVDDLSLIYKREQ